MKRLHDLHLGGLQAIPQDHVACLERELAAALPDQLHALGHELEADDVLVARLVELGGHDHPAAVSQKRRRRAVDQHQLADRAPCHRAMELARSPISGVHVEAQMRGGQDLGPRLQPARGIDAVGAPPFGGVTGRPGC